MRGMRCRLYDETWAKGYTIVNKRYTSPPVFYLFYNALCWVPCDVVSNPDLPDTHKIVRSNVSVQKAGDRSQSWPGDWGRSACVFQIPP